MKKKFYIYAHINLSNDEIFYIGKGCGNRSNKTTNRSEFWNNIVSKYGYDILLIEEELTEEESFELEKYYINKIGRRDLGLGTLVNMTDGGEGSSNISESTRYKHSVNNTGDGNPFYGKKHNEESRSKIRESRSKQVFSEESKKRMSEAGKLRWLNKKSLKKDNI